MKITKVYTRTGDDGTTSLVGGIRIPKSSVRLEAYGTIDELNSHLGLLVALLGNDDASVAELRRIQSCLFNVGTYLATDTTQTPVYPSAKLPENAASELEESIDSMNASLPELRGFVLPGGSVAASQCHVCRTVCRRAERIIAALAAETPIDTQYISYINRLSDYLFVLARHINCKADINEELWQNPCNLS